MYLARHGTDLEISGDLVDAQGAFADGILAKWSRSSLAEMVDCFSECEIQCNYG